MYGTGADARKIQVLSPARETGITRNTLIRASPERLLRLLPLIQFFAVQHDLKRTHNGAAVFHGITGNRDLVLWLNGIPVPASPVHPLRRAHSGNPFQHVAILALHCEMN